MELESSLHVEEPWSKHKGKLDVVERKSRWESHGSLVASRNMQALQRESNVHLHKPGIGIGKCYVSANN
jgi:hypothetical protein